MVNYKLKKQLRKYSWLIAFMSAVVFASTGEILFLIITISKVLQIVFIFGSSKEMVKNFKP
ncbi:hypothetical protein BSK57_16440 [Paenibacillus odorifer]|nr:hypothetical protein BSK57_16440 [Paenibacillus odorifer]